MFSKIVTATKLKKILTHSKRKKIVFTNGCFDILHIGHVKYLQAAKSKGDILIIGLNADKSVRRLKGPQRPVTPQRERAQILAALDCVNYVVLFGEETPTRLISMIKPDILVKGGDWPLEKIVGADIVRAKKGRVLRIPFYKNRSTTSLLQKIQKLG